jgi:heme/copper-type cytochrome/quinol oxidase subunit 3
VSEVVLDPGSRDVDARALPSYAFGTSSLMWWGTVGVAAIEGTAFALAIIMYFYVRTRVQTWPPSADPPELIWGTVNTLILLAILIQIAPAAYAVGPHHLALLDRKSFV